MNQINRREALTALAVTPLVPSMLCGALKEKPAEAVWEDKRFCVAPGQACLFDIHGVHFCIESYTQKLDVMTWKQHPTWPEINIFDDTDEQKYWYSVDPETGCFGREEDSLVFLSILHMSHMSHKSYIDSGKSTWKISSVKDTEFSNKLLQDDRIKMIVRHVNRTTNRLVYFDDRSKS